MSTRVPHRGAVWRIVRGVKRRLLWILIAFGIGAGSTWYYREAAFRLLLAPAEGSLSPFDGLPTYTAPTEMFNATIGLAMKGGVVAAFPVATYSVLQALASFLPHQQRQFIVFFLPATLVCFVGGAAFAYFVMLPTGLRFLLHFGENVAVPTIRISEYMSLISAMVLWIGIVFELPPVMFLLAKLRIVSHRQFRRFRKHVPVTALILSAIITPTFDAVNQLMVAVPIILLFEVGLFLAWMARPKEAGYRSPWQRCKPTVVWVLRWLPVALVVALLGVVIWQLVVSSLDGRLNMDDWHRFLKDWERFLAEVRRRVPFQ